MTLQMLFVLNVLSAHGASVTPCEDKLTPPEKAAVEATTTEKTDVTGTPATAPAVVAKVEKTPEPRSTPSPAFKREELSLATINEQIRVVVAQLKIYEGDRKERLDRVAKLQEEKQIVGDEAAKKYPKDWQIVQRNMARWMAQSEVESRIQYWLDRIDEIDRIRRDLNGDLRVWRERREVAARQEQSPAEYSGWANWSMGPINTAPVRPAVEVPKISAAELAAREEKRKGELRDQILTYAQKHEFAGDELSDLLSIAAIQRLLSAMSAVYVMLGEQWTEATRLSLLNAVEGGHYVVYDADSPRAGDIQQLLGRKAIGISAIKEDTAQLVFKVKNPYRRLMVFDLSRRQGFFGPDSVTAVGALLMNYTQSIVVQADAENRKGLADGPAVWQEHLESTSRGYGFGGGGWGLWSSSRQQEPVERNQNLGVSGYSRYSRPHVVAEAVRFERASTPNPDLNIEFSIFNELSRLSSQNLSDLLYQMQGYSSAMEMGAHKDMPRGVVLYGSSGGSQIYEVAVRQVSRAAAGLFGMLASGGAGGFMRTANSAARDMKALSVGVPIGGRGALEQEKVVFKEVQTLTIPTSGYESRIPVLGYNRIAALIAPGGRGTIREIATWLFQEAYSPNPGLLIFISRSYYGPLVQWFKSLPLPEAFRSRIYVIDNDEEMIKIARDHELVTEADVARVQSALEDFARIPPPPPPPPPSEPPRSLYDQPQRKSFGTKTPTPDPEQKPLEGAPAPKPSAPVAEAVFRPTTWKPQGDRVVIVPPTEDPENSKGETQE